MLLKLSEGLLINPEFISVVEQKKIRGRNVLTIWIDGRSYNINDDNNDFMNTLKLIDRNDKKEYFAG